MAHYAALAGAAVTIGAFLVVAGLIRHPPAPGPRPPSRGFRSLSRNWRKLVLGGVAGAAIWWPTGWPVAAFGFAVAIVTLPRMLTGRAGKQRISRLEALARWPRRLSGTVRRSATFVSPLDPYRGRK